MNHCFGFLDYVWTFDSKEEYMQHSLQIRKCILPMPLLSCTDLKPLSVKDIYGHLLSDLFLGGEAAEHPAHGNGDLTRCIVKTGNMARCHILTIVQYLVWLYCKREN